MSNLCTPSRGDWLADAADRLSTPPPSPPPHEKRRPLFTPFVDKSRGFEEVEEEEKENKENEKNKDKETRDSSLILHREICLNEIIEMFLQTNEEQEAENILECLTREEEVRISHWEPYFQSRVICCAKPPREGRVFLLENNDFIENVPSELIGKLQNAWFVNRSIGLEYLWRDEVTFADVVALRMRYFVRRYDAIKWVVFRVFFKLRKSNACNDRFEHSESKRNLGNTWELLWFIDAINEIGLIFGKVKELCWSKYIQIRMDEYNVDKIIILLQDDCYSKRYFSELNTDPFDQNKEKRTYGESNHSRLQTESKKRLPSLIETLLTCTALLCLHVDNSLSVITYNDVCATHHCLSVAALSKKGKYDRLFILKMWEDEYASVNYLAEQRTTRVLLQQREGRQRDALEVEEFTNWLKVLQSVFSTCTVKSGILTTLPKVMNPSPLYYPFNSVSRSTIDRNVLGTSMNSTVLDPVMSRSRWTVRQREADRQRSLKEQRQVEQVAYMLQNGKLSF
ncbi:hypothetical protein LSM04_002685 [Trypanosoma melophagium]|uniref:uncharacterized protein n=1 Tax=Trypanosoma melophagium TaxID=715481 RepID=UPI00351A55D6|nr:hypothetical protein LSM04_002685 [Trypanosoma melophagium]